MRRSSAGAKPRLAADALSACSSVSRAAARTSASRCAAVSRGLTAAPVAAATWSLSRRNVWIEAPSTARPPAQSSRSKRVASSAVGTSSIGSSPRRASSRVWISPERPEFGGPTISESDTTSSIGSASDVRRSLYLRRVMSLCFIDPADAIRAIADSVGREARRQLLGEAVRAWVDEIPDTELETHYAKAISELDEHDISMLAAWHGSMEVGHPVPNRDFLMGAFDSLGEHRREALKLAAGFRGEEAFEEGVSEERALDIVLEWLSGPRLMELAREATELYIWDRAGSDN